MKILYLITKSEAGGAQTHIWQMTRFMKSLGHEVAVMSFPGGWLEKEIGKLGARFYPNEYLTNAMNPIADIRASSILRKALADFRPDLVSCHSTKAGIIGRLTIRDRIPTVFTAHGWGFTEGVSLPRRIMAIAAERFASRYSRKIICVSEHDRQLALRYRIAPMDKLITIHNGVELNVPVAALDVNENIAAKIIYIGRLAEPKDPGLLLEAFRGLADELRKRAQIEIIGNGPKRRELEHFITGNDLGKKVFFRSAPTREEAFIELSQAHIFALITKYEGFPRTILEAMSVGLPVIASDVGGIKEAVTPECGILVPRDDKNAIRSALETLLRDPERIKTMGKAARARVEQNFSLEKMLEATKAVYAGL